MTETGHPSLSEYFSTVFPGKVRKIPVNAGLGCPNRDGTVGVGGCIFCNNEAFNPRYAAASGDIYGQLDSGIGFFRRKGDVYGYLAYFQSFSNTYGETGKLVSLYEEALGHPGIVGLVIATRPDCLAPELLDYFESRFGHKAPDGHPYLLVEIGIESTNDKTLERINRGHVYGCAERAVKELAGRGLNVGAHIILGLPGETEEDYIRHARRLSELPLRTLKLHHLQVVRGTALADEYATDPESMHLFTPDEYAHTVRLFLSNLRRDIAVDRLVSETPKDLIIAPSWGIKPTEFKI